MPRGVTNNSWGQLTPQQSKNARYQWGPKRAETALLQLREYYRVNFQNGESDSCFLLWIESKFRDDEVSE